MQVDLEKRFWSKVGIRNDNDCWEWTAGRTSRGYGKFWIFGRTKSAHRVGFELVYGPIPERLFVCHSCDNPPCINPEHWFLGTQGDNIKDAFRKGRIELSRIRGENHGQAKLTEDDVLEIREKTVQGISGTYLAKIFGVTPSCICLIVNRKNWNHI